MGQHKKCKATCVICSSEFYCRPYSGITAKYCSRKCQGAAYRLSCLPKDVDGIRICSICKHPKALGCFYKPHKHRGEIREHKQCIDCLHSRQGKYREENVEKIRERHRKDSHNQQLHRYKMSKADYAIKNEAQGGRCSICGSDNGGRRLFVDHDHSCCKGIKTCGKCIRGLLCSKCNLALHFIENREFLIAAEIYLWQHSKEVEEISVK